ncbi:helix-turn-helix domain-containing protein [Bacillus cereus]|uniref:helix-turn-helix domain-containing protein n=1 Tax=Bacillus cereus TaxID=1396 RepID=UPI001E2A479A|nr:helix-turn-helix transcriptional regulator [Bacillus cereus]MCD2338638.1 helix-turn-helix domain-containing protein [Bacillus cereus]
MIGKKIREARTTLGISQRQLAGNEMTRAYISLIEKGHANPSDKTLRIIAKKLNKPIDFFLGETNEDSFDVCDAILERAKLKKDLGEYETALNMVKKVFTMTQDQQLLAEGHFVSLNIKLDLGEYEETLKEYEEALPLFLELKDRQYLVELYMKAGKAAFKIENFPLAKKAYEFAIKYSDQLKKLQDERIQALTYLGTTNIRLGNLSEAISAYLEAEDEVSMTGDTQLHGDIALGLGKAYYRNNMIEDASKWTKKAISLYDSNDEESNVLALHNLAIIEAFRNKKEEMVKILTKCLTIYEKQRKPNKQASVLEELSKYYLSCNEISKAKEFCNKAIRLLDETEDGILRAKLYRLMGVILACEDDFEQSYYLLRMSYDLLIRLKSSDEATISLQLLKVEEYKIKELYLKIMEL